MTEIHSDKKLQAIILAMQKSEISEHLIYNKIASATRDPHNKEILNHIADDELSHYEIWKKYSGRDTPPDYLRVWWYAFAARVFGITFTIKLLENVEHRAQGADRALVTALPDAAAVLHNEEIHERELIALIDEERLKYVGSVVLGLNDALVEFTGTLAGLTFAIQNTQIIAIAGLIMGVAASLSMGASEYLSQRSESGPADPFKASLYTGTTYIATVALLILPFLILSSPYIALGLTLLGAVFVIFVFTFYISVAKDLPFWLRFFEMAAISLGIAAISFLIGIVIRFFLNVNI
jgi:VIT1/CCC1 family predicted Fe2+/Mn2+ transporter